MDIYYSTDKLKDTFIRIYSKESGILRRTKYLAEIHTRDKRIKRVYELDPSILQEFIKTYKHLFEIANLPWPVFNSESLKNELIEFSQSEIFARMLGTFMGGLHIDYKLTDTGFVLKGNHNQFHLELSHERGRFIHKGNPIFARVTSNWNTYDCDVQLTKEQVQLFMGLICFRFNLGLMPSALNHTSYKKIYKPGTFYDMNLTLLTYQNQHIRDAKLVINNHCNF